MARTGITYHEVANAIAALQGKQKNPTIDTIREELGTGSKSTIAKFLNEWKSKNAITNTNEMGIPNELLQLIHGLWEKIHSDANEKINAHQLDADTQINELNNTVSKTEQQSALLHAEIKNISEKLNSQTQISDQLKNTVGNLENEKVTLNARMVSLESHNHDHKNENNRLHLLLKNTQDNLAHYQQKIEEQQQEQTLLREKERGEYEQKLSQLQNQLNAALHEKTQYQTRLESLTEHHNKLITDFETEKNNACLLQKNHDRLSLENTHLESIIEKLNAQQEKLSRDLDNKNNENTAFYIQLKSSENNHAVLKNSIEKIEHKMQTLQSQYEKTLQEKYFLEASTHSKKLAEEIK